MMIGLAILGFQAGTAPVAGAPEACCPPLSVRLSAREMKARLRHTVPVSPLVGKDVRVKGVVVFVIGIGTYGDVACIRLISGHPMLVAAAMDSVKRWKFESDTEPLCGKLVLTLSTLMPDMGLQILDTEPSRHKRS